MQNTFSVEIHIMIDQLINQSVSQSIGVFFIQILCLTLFLQIFAVLMYLAFVSFASVSSEWGE